MHTHTHSSTWQRDQEGRPSWLHSSHESLTNLRKRHERCRRRLMTCGILEWKRASAHVRQGKRRCLQSVFSSVLWVDNENTASLALPLSLCERLAAVLFSSRGARGGSHLWRRLADCPSQTCGCRALVGNVQNPIKARRLLHRDRNQYLKQKGLPTLTACRVYF